MFSKKPAKPKEYQPGTLVFIPQSFDCYSTIWEVVRFGEPSTRGKRHVCHRIDTETGRPMACPDPRCEGRGLACCAITTFGGWPDELEPLTKDAVELFSTEEPTVLDRKYAKKCLEFAPSK